MRRIFYLFAISILSTLFILNCSESITEPVPLESSWVIRLEYHGWELDDPVFQGHYVNLGVILDSMPDTSLDGFNFLIAYDDEALTFMTAEFADATWCWEYFNYELGPFDDCGEDCPSGLVRLTGLRDVNYGPYHPEGCEGADGFFDNLGVTLADIIFYVTDDREYECVYVPVYFYWLDCGDNTIACGSDEMAYISNRVFNLSLDSSIIEYYEIEPPDGYIDPDDHIFGAFDICEDNTISDMPGYNRSIDFFNGCLHIVCAEDIDQLYFIGDINLNGIANQIEDAILFSNYFVYGPSVFIIDSLKQTLATDVNMDTEFATLEDLEYLIRVITGDAIPYDNLQHDADTVSLSIRDSILAIDTYAKVGSISMTFDDETFVTFLADGMDMLCDNVNGQTKVLIYNIGTHYIPAGEHDVLEISDDAAIIHFEAADYDGNRLVTIIENP